MCDGIHISIVLLAWKLEPIDDVQSRCCHVSVRIGGPVQTNHMMLVHILPKVGCAHSGLRGRRPQARNCDRDLIGEGEGMTGHTIIYQRLHPAATAYDIKCKPRYRDTKSVASPDHPVGVLPYTRQVSILQLQIAFDGELLHGYSVFTKKVF